MPKKREPRMIFNLARRLAFLISLILLSLQISQTAAAAPKTAPQIPVASKKESTSPEQPAKLRGAQTAAPAVVAPSTTTPAPAGSPPGAAANTGVNPVVAPVQRADKVLATINGIKITQADFERELFQKGINPAGNDLTEQVIDETFQSLISGILAEQYLANAGRLSDQTLKDRIDYLRTQAINEYFFYYVARNLKPIDKQEEDAFVAENPDFFKDRRFYYYSSLEFKKDLAVDLSQIKKMLYSSDNFDKIAEFLNSKKIRYELFRGFKPSEQITQNILEKLKTLSPGEGGIVNAPDSDNVYVVKLFSTSADPVDPVKAHGVIINGMFMTRAAEQVNQLMKQMREGADIKYIDKPKAASVSLPGKFVETNAKSVKPPSNFFKTFGGRNTPGTDKNSVARASVSESIDKLDEEKTKKNELYTFIKNVWIFSSMILFPAAFLHFRKMSNFMYGELINAGPQANASSGQTNTQLKRLSLDPILTWMIGLIAFAILSYMAWNEFFEINMYFSLKNMLSTVGVALLGSAALIFILYKSFPLFPDFIKNSRFIFILSILLINVLVLKMTEIFSL